MTEAEALKLLSNYVIDTSLGLKVMADTSDFMNTCKKALEKQIPQKVIRKDIREHARFFCPNNHFIFEEHCKIFDLCKHDFSKSGYCECCGQKLDWGDEE